MPIRRQEWKGPNGSEEGWRGAVPDEARDHYGFRCRRQRDPPPHGKCHPNQAFVLDHIAKPQIKIDLFEPWQANIRELAKRDNVTCKLSGMVTEADFSTWTESQLRPYLDTVLAAFGPERLMFGSDWPVCLVATGYKRWHDLIREYIHPLSNEEQTAIMGGTAIQAYKL